jgi:hypothetical protein
MFAVLAQLDYELLCLVIRRLLIRLLRFGRLMALSGITIDIGRLFGRLQFRLDLLLDLSVSYLCHSLEYLVLSEILQKIHPLFTTLISFLHYI